MVKIGATYYHNTQENFLQPQCKNWTGDKTKSSSLRSEKSTIMKNVLVKVTQL